MFYLDPNYDMAKFAIDMKMNRTYVSRFCNNVLGMPFRTLIASLRLKHAVELMKYKDMTLQEIAKASGFASDMSFRRTYVKEYGQNPSNGR